jgi:hypothetical protein
MAGVPEARVRELVAALRPAAPGVALALAALVLAATAVVVALFRQPLALAASLLGLVVAARWRPWRSWVRGWCAGWSPSSPASSGLAAS